MASSAAKGIIWVSAKLFVNADAAVGGALVSDAGNARASVLAAISGCAALCVWILGASLGMGVPSSSVMPVPRASPISIAWLDVSRDPATVTDWSTTYGAAIAMLAICGLGMGFLAMLIGFGKN